MSTLSLQVTDFLIFHQVAANRYFKVGSKETRAEKSLYLGCETEQINEENIKAK